MKRIGAVLFLAVILTAWQVSAGGRECISATCRVRTGSGIGTGVAYYGKTGPDIYVATAKHVVEGHSEVECDFFIGSPVAKAVKGVVIVARGTVDIAVIRIPKAVFGNALPAIIPFARRNPRGNEILISVGCRNGEAPTVFKTTVSGFTDDGSFEFNTFPAMGRSGSAMFDKDGTCVLGILVARNEDSGKGLAESVSRFASIAGSEKKLQYISSQCGPNGCPSPGVSQFGIINRVVPPQFTPIEPIPGWDDPSGPVTADIVDAQARQGIIENRNAIGHVSEAVNAVSVRVDALDGGAEEVAKKAEEAEKKAGEASAAAASASEAVPGVVEEQITGKLSGYAKSWVTWLLGGFGITGVLGSLIAVIAVWFLRGKIKANAMAIAIKIDEMTDKTKTNVDDKMIDGFAYKIAELLSGEQRPENWDTNEKPLRRTATKRK